MEKKKESFFLSFFIENFSHESFNIMKHPKKDLFKILIFSILFPRNIIFKNT